MASIVCNRDLQLPIPLHWCDESASVTPLAAFNLSASMVAEFSFTPYQSELYELYREQWLNNLVDRTPPGLEHDPLNRLWVDFCAQSLGPGYDLLDQLTQGATLTEKHTALISSMGLTPEADPQELSQALRRALESGYEQITQFIPPVVVFLRDLDLDQPRQVVALAQSIQLGSTQEYLLTEAATFLSQHCEELRELNHRDNLGLAKLITQL